MLSWKSFLFEFVKPDIRLAHLYLLLVIADAQVGFVAASADVAELLDRLGWHGLGEAEATPCVCGLLDLCDHRLPLHG